MEFKPLAFLLGMLVGLFIYKLLEKYDNHVRRVGLFDCVRVREYSFSEDHSFIVTVLGVSDLFRRVFFLRDKGEMKVKGEKLNDGKPTKWFLYEESVVLKGNYVYLVKDRALIEILYRILGDIMEKDDWDVVNADLLKKFHGSGASK